MDVFRRLWPADMFDLAAMEASVLHPQAKFASMGVTSFQDVYARDMDRVQAYFNLASRGQMSIRGQIMNVLEYFQELEGASRAWRAMRFENDYMHLAGASSSLTASWSSRSPTSLITDLMERSIWKPDDLNQCVRAFHDRGLPGRLARHRRRGRGHGFECHRGSHECQPAPGPAASHRTLHSQHRQRPGAHKDLGVVISTQPQAIRMFADGLQPIWGDERVQRIIPPAPGWRWACRWP